MAGVEELVGLGVTIALTDLFTEGAEKIAAKFEEMEKAAGGSGENIKKAIEGIKVGMGLLGAGAAIFAPMAMLADKSAQVADAAEDIKTVYEGLAPGGAEILKQVEGLSASLRTIPTGKLVDAGRDMLGMGVAAERIPTLLKAAGISATVLGDGIQASVHRMKMLNDMAEQGMAPKKLLQKMGVSFEDLGAEGIQMDKHGKFKASADDYMDAVSSIITKRLGETATKLGEGLSGIEPDIERQFHAFYLNAGQSGILMLKTGMMQGYLDLLKELHLDEIGAAFGEGLSRFYRWLMMALKPVQDLVMALAKFIGQHPGIVKFATTFLLVAASVLVLTGAFIILGGLVTALPMALSLVWGAIVAGVSSALAVLAPLIPFALAFAAVAAFVYYAWTENLYGIRDTMLGWFDSLELIIEGVVALFTENGDGQLGSIPAELHDKLVEKGLWGISKGIFLWGWRLVEFFKGMWDGIVAPFKLVGYIAQPLVWVFGVLGNVIGITAKAFGVASNQMFEWNGFGLATINIAQVLGYAIGVLIGIWGVLAAATAWPAAAMFALKVAIWGVNIAFAVLTSPVTLVVLGVLALGAAIASVIAYWDVFMHKMEQVMDSKAMRWLMRKAGLIDEKTTDAQLDEAAKQRDQAYAQSIAQKKAAGREGFMARMVDILPGQIGVPGGGSTVDQALPRSVNPEQAANEDMMQRLQDLRLKGATPEAMSKGPAPMSPEEMLSRSPANEHVGADDGRWDELMSRLEANASRPIEITSNLHLDGEQIHSAVRRVDQDLQSRAGG